MRAGEIVAGRFVVERILGTGGMGSVFAAFDRGSGGRVALKVLERSSDDAVERFRREARLLCELSHPGIVHYVAHGKTDDGVPFLAMEWLVGEDLEKRLRLGPLGVGECLALSTRVTGALAYAHKSGIVHRDLKPSNLFLVDGEPARTKILDFGIAKSIGATRALTRSGTIIGTAGYMAPEHVFGDVTLDPRSDLFSLGCVIFEALTGRGPFAAKYAAAVFAKILNSDPPPLGTLVEGIPRTFEKLVEQLLAKSPEARPATASEVLETLERLSSTILGSRRKGTADSVVSTATQLDKSAESRSTHTPPQQDGQSQLRGAEQQFASVILVEFPEYQLEDATLPSDRFLDSIEDVVQVTTRFGGEPTRLVGRGLLAIFRSSGGEARDQATRAAACALAMLDATPEAARARIVVATGTAESGQALGRAVDRAADLLADAGRSGVVKLDTVTARLVSNRYEVADGEIKSSRESGSSEVFVPLLGKQTPYVGRRKDLALLCATLEEAVDERVVRRVVVTGASGMGKTRLRREFVRRARRELDPLVLQAAGDVVRAGSSLLLGKQLLRGAMHLREAETPEAVQRSVGAHLDDLIARDLTFEFLCELLDAPVANPDVALKMARSEPGEMAERLARSFATWLCAECKRRPVLIVLDDVQWGDAGTLHYLDQTREQLGDRALMIVAFARPEALDNFPALCARDVQRIDLSPLGLGPSIQLVRAALGDEVPAVIAEKIAIRANGNAFYLEELIRHVVEGGSIDDSLPETVLAMAQARFERFEPEARHVLRAASVFGETFWESGVVHLLRADYASHAVGEWLRILHDRELLKARSDSRLGGQVEHAFRHSLVREAAFASLSGDDRRTAHGLAAAWLEESGEPDPLAIAEHWERSREPSRAAAHFSTAASLAAWRHDENAVEVCVRRGLSCTPDDQTRCTLLVAAGAAAFVAADWSRLLAVAIEALPLAPRGGELWYTIASGVLIGESFGGKIERSPELIVALLDPGLPVPRSLAVGRSLCGAAAGLLVAGLPPTAAAALSRIEAIDARRPPGEDEPGFALYRHIACVWWHFYATGDFGSALQAAEEARVASAQVADPFSRTAALVAHAHVLGTIGPEGAIRRLSEELGPIQLGKQFVFWFRGMALTHDVARGVPLAVLEERIRELPEPSTAQDRALVSYLFAQAHLVAGEYQAAERRALDMVADPSPIYQWFARACLALTALEREDIAAALDHTDAGMQVPVGNGLLHRSLLLLARAEALRAAGCERDAMGKIAEARWFVLASVSGLPEAVRDDCLQRIWANVRVLRTARAWLGE